MGAPRYDDPRTPNKGTPTGAGVYADIGAFEFVETAPSDKDLVVTSVTGPSSVLAGDMVPVQWTLTNAGTGVIVGPWRDTLYLSTGPSETENALMAGELLVGKGVTLGPGQSYTASGIVRVPGAPPGYYNWLVFTNSRGDIFEGINRNNNTTTSLATSYVDLPSLAVNGAALSARFTTPNESHWYQFYPAPGQSIVLSLDLAFSGSTELYVARGYIPTREKYESRHSAFNAADVMTAVSQTAWGPYYVLAYSRALPFGPSDYTLTARSIDFALNSVSPTTAGNVGRVTFTVQGAQMTADMTYELVDPAGNVYTPVYADASVGHDLPPGSSTAYATFDLTGRPTGLYDLRVVRGQDIVSLDDAILVRAGKGAQLETSYTLADMLRARRPFSIRLEYANTGDTDMPAPLLTFIAPDGAALWCLAPVVPGTNYLGGCRRFQRSARHAANGRREPGTKCSATAPQARPASSSRGTANPLRFTAPASNLGRTPPMACAVSSPFGRPSSPSPTRRRPRRSTPSMSNSTPPFRRRWPPFS